jgi:hypothetical protein
VGYIRSPYGYGPRYYSPSISDPRYYTGYPRSYATSQREAVDAYYNVPTYRRGLKMSSRRALLAKEPKVRRCKLTAPSSVLRPSTVSALETGIS